MAGYELYISEMLSNFKEEMTQAMSDLSASMKEVAEGTSGNVEIMRMISQNTSQTISALKAVSSENVKFTNEEAVSVTVTTSNRYASIFKILADGSIKIKISKINLIASFGGYTGKLVVGSNDPVTLGSNNGPAVPCTLERDFIVSYGDEIKVYADGLTSGTATFSIPIGCIEFCYNLVDLINDGAIVQI